MLYKITINSVGDSRIYFMIKIAKLQIYFWKMVVFFQPYWPWPFIWTSRSSLTPASPPPSWLPRAEPWWPLPPYPLTLRLFSSDICWQWRPAQFLGFTTFCSPGLCQGWASQWAATPPAWPAGGWWSWPAGPAWGRQGLVHGWQAGSEQGQAGGPTKHNTEKSSTEKNVKVSQVFFYENGNKVVWTMQQWRVSSFLCLINWGWGEPSTPPQQTITPPTNPVSHHPPHHLNTQLHIIHLK